MTITTQQIFDNLNHYQLQDLYRDFCSLINQDVLVTPNIILLRLLEAEEQNNSINQIIALQSSFNQEFVSRFMNLQFFRIQFVPGSEPCTNPFDCPELVNPKTNYCNKCSRSFNYNR